MLKDVALKDLTVNLGSSRLQELTEFALHVDNNRESDQKLCIGKCLFRQLILILFYCVLIISRQKNIFSSVPYSM